MIVCRQRGRCDRQDFLGELRGAFAREFVRLDVHAFDGL